MKIVFAGPTIQGANIAAHRGLQLRAPARQGDVYRAVRDGAAVIGLIDGVFEQVPAIWHKEILFGLSKGVRIYGAASMGALRAVECAVFGMIGVGRIYDDMIAGLIEDDAEVAQAHGPQELGFLALSEPLANVRATLGHCLSIGLLSRAEHELLLSVSRSIFFKERTLQKVVSRAARLGDERSAEILAALKSNFVNQKLLDAQMLIDAVAAAPPERSPPPTEWTFNATDMWMSVLPARAD